ncbi:MAG: GspH/FimT family pseudopilin [Steroidobacteraceae bacterium]
MFVRQLTTTYRDTALSGPSPRARPTRQSGFTLIELVIVMILVGILAAIGIPSFRSITTSSRMSAESNTLLGDLQYARAEAAREGEPVTVCIANTASTACNAASNTWQGGWIIFSDLNDDQTVDTGDAVLRVQRAFSSTDTFTSGNTDYAVTFTREGFAYLGAAAGGLIVTLHNTPYNDYYSRCLEITQAGMMSIQTPTSDAAGCS